MPWLKKQTWGFAHAVRYRRSLLALARKLSDYPIKGYEYADVTVHLLEGLGMPTQNLIGWSNSLIDTYFMLPGPQNWLWGPPGRFLWPWQQMMAEMWLVKCFNRKIQVWKRRNQGKSYERKLIDHLELFNKYSWTNIINISLWFRYF